MRDAFGRAGCRQEFLGDYVVGRGDAESPGSDGASLHLRQGHRPAPNTYWPQRSRFARISSPISFVETSLVPSDQISLVRKPCAIVLRTADSIRPAVPSKWKDSAASWPQRESGQWDWRSLACDIRGRSSARFIEPKAVITMLAGSQAGAWQHPDRAGQHGQFVAENVAKKISVTTTSNVFGARMNCIAALSTSKWVNSTSG